MGLGGLIVYSLGKTHLHVHIQESYAKYQLFKTLKAMKAAEMPEKMTQHNVFRQHLVFNEDIQ